MPDRSRSINTVLILLAFVYRYGEDTINHQQLMLRRELNTYKKMINCTLFDARSRRTNHATHVLFSLLMQAALRVSCLLFAFHTIEAQPSGFLYHGYLSEKGIPVNGVLDFRFSLFETADSGLAPLSVVESVQLGVTNGVFRAQLEFEPKAFGGLKRWVGISIRSNSTAQFRELTPLQLLPTVPSALVAGTVIDGSVSSAKLADGAVTDRHLGTLTSLTVDGQITSKAGGIMFPDGSRQTSAAFGDPRLNVRLFGAKGDGTTDDSDAFKAAFSALQSRGGATVYIPAGTYRLSTRLETSVPTSIVGEGRGLSVLVWATPGGGIRFNGGELGGRTKRTFSMRQLTLTASVPESGNALELYSGVGIGNIGRTLDVVDCDFYQNQDGAYWNCGIWLDDIRDTHISNCEFRGQEQEHMGTAGVGIRIGGSRSPTGHLVEGCQFIGLETAVRIEGTVEGVLISKCGTVGRRGIVWNTDRACPLMNVDSCHFDVTESGISAHNLGGGVFRDCTFYPRKGAASVRVGVYLSGATDDIHVSHCRFSRGNPITETDPDNFNGVVVSAPAKNIRIDNNTVLGARTGIWIQGGARDCLLFDNVSELTFALYFDQGVGTRIRTIPSAP